jgi:major vault protein
VERQRKLMDLELQRQKQLAELEVAKAKRLAEVEATTFKERVIAMEGGENFVRAVAAQAQAAVVGGIEKVVFVPTGSGLNLYSSMQDLLGGMMPQKKAAENGEPKKDGGA